VCLPNKPDQRERERALGQGDRGGGGPAARATEGNAGPVPFRASLVELQRWTGLFGKHTLTLRRAGWRVLRIWEHELTRRNERRLLARLRRYGLALMN
jgi:hypothetical protein